jgi:two-component system cell cycle response regulator DivK
MPQVLYIEDNSDNRMLVRRILMASDYDFVIKEAESAQKGIEMALAQPPDIILMDLSMPEMDGLTATKRIRSLPTLNDILIVALTANAMDSDRDRSLEAGCDGYIRKPIDVDKFPDEVFSFIRSRHERRSKQQSADADLD